VVDLAVASVEVPADAIGAIDGVFVASATCRTAEAKPGRQTRRFVASL
jgi:hypothetical protein